MLVIARQLLDQPLGKAPILLPRNGRYRPHAAAWSSLADDSVAEEDEAIVHMRDMGLLHIQRELQLVFEELSACFAYCLSMRLVPLTTITKSSAYRQ